MQIHLLDMGTEKYGDCVLVMHNNKTILIDGAHPGDESMIKSQLKSLLNKNPPFRIDLLVVTHCHSDHVGCLPAMIAMDYIHVGKALLADPKLRWASVDVTDDALYSDSNVLIQALQEEPRADMSDEALTKFLSDAVDVKPDYMRMIRQLEDAGIPVQFYQGVDEDYSDITNEFADFGLQILGPTKEHLNICFENLTADAVSDEIAKLVDTADSQLTLVDAYRQLTNQFQIDSDDPLQDGKNNGAAVNDQSIVLKLHADGWSALLAGDMQWASTGVTGLSPYMKALLTEVNAQGPYDFIKLTHHTASNGLNAAMLDIWIQTTKLYAHSGGKDDEGHPNEKVLNLLKARADEGMVFGRTDSNGIITVQKDDGEVMMYISKGDFNDFRPNKVGDAIHGEEKKDIETSQLLPNTELPAVQAVAENIPNNDFVEVVTKVPHTSTKVTITIDIDQKKNSSTQKLGDIKPPLDVSGSRFNNLLFITSSAILANNIGQAEANKVIDWITKAEGAKLIDIKPVRTAKDAYAQVVKYLHNEIRGVIIIGGYDVVPSSQLDVLDEELREELKADNYDGFDADNFIVWSDDIYGDIEGDSFPEIPVSRIPDGKSAELVFAAINAPSFSKRFKFGIRNLARPFAVDIYNAIPATTAHTLEISEQCSPTNIAVDKAQGAVYYMLHGANHDATRFWGETDGGDSYEAFDIDNIPRSTPGTIIFAGCCWGALTVQPAAYRYNLETKLRPRTPDQSIALSYLRAGALAYVGCTGTHYSPEHSPYNFFGKPMHNAFWKGVNEGLPPALALFKAKQKYAADVPHGLSKSFEMAIEVKILREFTCLGLGW